MKSEKIAYSESLLGFMSFSIFMQFLIFGLAIAYTFFKLVLAVFKKLKKWNSSEFMLKPKMYSVERGMGE